MTTQADLAPDGTIGMMGISFSGGLSIVAAGRSTLRDRVAFVMSFGGHGDLVRVMRYLCSGRTPDLPPDARARSVVVGADSLVQRPPHDYGVTVVLLTFADKVVPAEQVEPLRKGIGGLPARVVADAGRPGSGRSGVRAGAGVCRDPAGAVAHA